MQTSQPFSRLPFVDEHATTIAAGAGDVWSALAETLEAAFSQPHAARFARFVRCADTAASGTRPLAAGSAIPGFRVTTAVPGSELVLEGRHRFSDYALIFRIDQAGAGRSRLRAESRAAFPGLAGGAYRLLVIRTGGHVVGVRRLLSAVAARAESRARTHDR